MTGISKYFDRHGRESNTWRHFKSLDHRARVDAILGTLSETVAFSALSSVLPARPLLA